MSSKRRFFYGVRVQIMSMSNGMPLKFCILPGAGADLQGLAKLALELPKSAQLFVDGGYNFYKWEEYLLKVENLKLQVPRKANSKRAIKP